MEEALALRAGGEYGAGSLAHGDAVAARDYTTIMGTTIFFSTILILGNIVVDVMYTWLDPRIRFD